VQLKNKVIVVTGAGSGIGEAMSRRFAQEDPTALILVDLNGAAVDAVATDLGAASHRMDVSDAEANRLLVEDVEARFGPIDLFCANAGYGVAGSEQSDPEEWDRMWHVNLMSHVHAAKYLIPGWLARGEGYFLATASAAGLLTNLKAAQYSVTKHAVVSFAEWLAVTYGDRGVRVSCLCPMGVDTPFVRAATEFQDLLGPHLIDAEVVADAVVAGIESERFLILPHPEVEKYAQNKTNDYDRWISGMQRLQQSVFPN
jgi:NAD(P)-dependent dehydrogenase (short-subunit alcohol dehydrogenase family)